MKVIEQEFVRKGFTHKIVARNGMVAIVERKHADVSRPHWEVVRIRLQGEKSLHGQTLEAGEYYPSPKDWGTDGWTFNTLEEAQTKFAQLV